MHRTVQCGQTRLLYFFRGIYLQKVSFYCIGVVMLAWGKSCFATCSVHRSGHYDHQVMFLGFLFSVDQKSFIE